MSLITVRLAAHHDRASFSCGNASLDAYIRTMAGQDMRRDMATVYVWEGDPPSVIQGYYTLNMTGFSLGALPVARRRKLPYHDTVSGSLLGRLALSRTLHGTGSGATLLFDAIRRVITISEGIAAYAIVVDAIDDAAARFYAHHGFMRFDDQPQRLFLPLVVARQLVTGE